jgi:DNA-directed RNA polymerase specialized sigma24 family protein
MDAHDPVWWTLTMPDERDPGELIRRMRAGDRAAAEDLFRQCESLIRTILHVHFACPRSGRPFDSADIGQSVMKDLLQRINGGEELKLGGQREFLAYLKRMVRNNLADKWRRGHAQRRDCARTEGDEGLGGVAAAEKSPSEIAELRDELATIRIHMTDSQWRVANQRAEGRTWPEIDPDSPDAARIHFDRVAARLRRRVGG